jgi:hypothetical protein
VQLLDLPLNLISLLLVFLVLLLVLLLILLVLFLETSSITDTATLSHSVFRVLHS